MVKPSQLKGFSLPQRAVPVILRCSNGFAILPQRIQKAGKTK
jgi:hypothetical protein